MATKQATVDYLLDQLAGAGAVRAQKMFGEYGLYCDGKIVALICDDQLFLKPTEAGRSFIGEVTEGFAYPGAKASFLIDQDLWDDSDWLCELVRITERALPMAKVKKTKA
jgi:DNA transformation protein and related proteins